MCKNISYILKLLIDLFSKLMSNSYLDLDPVGTQNCKYRYISKDIFAGAKSLPSSFTR